MEERKKKDFGDLCSVLPTVPRDEKQSRRSFGLCHPRLISPKIPLENPNFIRLSSLSQSTSVKLSQRAQFLRLGRALKPLQIILAGWAIDCWTTPSHDRGHHRYPHIYWPSWVRGSIRDDAMAYWTLPRALPSPWIHVVVLNRKLTRLQSPVRRTTGPPLPTRSSYVLESVTASKVPLAVDAGSRPIGERCIVPDIQPVPSLGTPSTGPPKGDGPPVSPCSSQPRGQLCTRWSDRPLHHRLSRLFPCSLTNR